MRAERSERFKLKRRNFRDGDPVRFQLRKAGSDRLSDIAADHGILSRRAQNVSDHGDGRRLAVCPRNGNNGTMQGARAKFRLPYNRLAGFFEGDGERVVNGDPGT